MSHPANKLTRRQVVSVDTPGRYADGGGLYLQVTSSGARSWCFEFTRGEDEAQIALGDASIMSLTIARQRSADMQFAIAAGQDPSIILSPTPPDLGSSPTLGAFVLSYIGSGTSSEEIPNDFRRWRNNLHRYATPLLAKPIHKIDTNDVIGVLEPVWQRFPRMAQDLRRRLEKILDAAKAQGFRPNFEPNPATWRGLLVRLLPSQPRLARGHHAALHWKRAPDFMTALRSRQALTARCLEFLILTAARSGEVQGLRWGEVDWNTLIWRVPASRTSHGVERIVPLSLAASNLLRALQTNTCRPEMLAFSVTDKPISSKAIFMLLRRMGYEEITTYGFRTTFEQWATAVTHLPITIIEQALARKGKKDMNQRKDPFAMDLQRELMDAWAEFLST